MDFTEKAVVMTAADMNRVIARMASQVVENNPDLSGVLLVGIRRRGVPLAERIGAKINEMDAPRHTKVRRLLITAFSPASVKAVEPSVVALARRLVDDIAPSGHADLVPALTVPLPVTVVAGLPGVVIVAVPLTKLHIPVAGAMAKLAASVALLVGRQSCWSGPAFEAACALLKLVMVTWSLAVPQGA